MDSGTGSHELSQHRLGPHVVGQRVVVRRLVRGETGPSGGPALTDILGVCLSWSDVECVIAPATGEPVTIALVDVVSGKPVPPRASVRHRVSTREAEGHSFALWPRLDVLDIGDWVLRSQPVPEGRLFKRANSCLAIGDPDLPVEKAAARIVDFYTARDRAVLAQVEAESDIEDAFLALGWTGVPGENRFQVASVAQARRVLPGSSDVSVSVDGPRAVASLEGATGRAAIDGDWIGLYTLEVDPAYRRKGLALQILDALLEWGAEQGARTAWLHVEPDNEPALALYRRLGFLTHHTTRYVGPP